MLLLTAIIFHPTAPSPALEEEYDGGKEGRTRLSVSPQSWPPEVQQPEILNEIFKASVLSAVRWSRQTAGLHDVMPEPGTGCLIGLGRAGWSGDLCHCGLLRHYDAPRLHIRLVDCCKLYDQSFLSAAFSIAKLLAAKALVAQVIFYINQCL